MDEGATRNLAIEHPTGEMNCVLTPGSDGQVETAALRRTVLKLAGGTIFD